MRLLEAGQAYTRRHGNLNCAFYWRRRCHLRRELGGTSQEQRRRSTLFLYRFLTPTRRLRISAVRVVDVRLRQHQKSNYRYFGTRIVAVQIKKQLTMGTASCFYLLPSEEIDP